MEFFTELEQRILKSVWNQKRPQIAKTILKKNKTRGLTLSDLKTDYKFTVIKTVWYWHKDRHMDQWNRIKSPEIHLHIYGQMTFDKGANTI